MPQTDLEKGRQGKARKVGRVRTVERVRQSQAG